MSEFDQKYAKYVNTLPDPGLTVAQQLVLTAGKGRANTYHKPSVTVTTKTINLFEALNAFDINPTDITFESVKQILRMLELKAVRVAGSPEWIYITPDADPQKEKAKWERIALNTQFNLSWHVGSKSKVGASDEHNGGDGAFRVVGELVAQSTNLKLVMSNALHRNTSQRAKNGRFPADWAHSTTTIDYPVMAYLAQRDFSIINVHGWASRMYGLFVNNRTSNFTHERSLPTMIGIALAQTFRDVNNKKFVFGGVIPGSIIVNGKKILLSPANDQKSAPNALFYRATGVHNTNVIGNLIHNVQANKNHVNRFKYDSGNSCHIEFGIVRDGRGDLRKFAAAINLAAYWMNNYKPELNPWKVVKDNPDFDMTNYGSLYPADPALTAQLLEASKDTKPLASAVVQAPASEIDNSDSIALSGSDFNLNNEEQFLDPEGDTRAAHAANPSKPPVSKTPKPSKPLILSGGNGKTNKAAAAATTETISTEVKVKVSSR